MNALLVLLLLAAAPPEPSLLLLDTDLKKAIRHAEGFEPQDFFRQRFPVYAQDASALAAAAETLARRIDAEVACRDTVVAGHSILYFHRQCEGDKSFTVRLQTRLPESKAVFTILLVDAEPGKRGAQRRLLDLSNYLMDEDH